MTLRLVKHNPAFLPEDALIANFVVRTIELELMLEIIADNQGAANQHVLVVAQPGMGKTTLVLRVAAAVRADPELSARWYPLALGEEAYGVGTAAEFWLEVLGHLSDQPGQARLKAQCMELRRERDERRLYERALARLMDFADEQGKRILLIVENLNMTLNAQLTDEDAWLLRHTLQGEPRLMMLATATSRFDAIDNVNKAMYELFRIHTLPRLTEEESYVLWESVAGTALPRAQVRPIQILTGGNPRLVTILASFASTTSLRTLFDDLSRLVDERTHYFKANLESLPPLERKVFVALAEIWAPALTRVVAEYARIPVNKTSSLLARLVQRGAVEVVQHERGRKSYQLTERMYNIYYLMRSRGSNAGRVRALVRFMTLFYGNTHTTISNLEEAIAADVEVLEPFLRAEQIGVLEELSGPALPSLSFELTERTKRRADPAHESPLASYLVSEAPEEALVEAKAQLLEVLKWQMEEMGEPDKALGTAEEVLRRGGRSAASLGLLARTFLVQGWTPYFVQAEAWAREALQKDPSALDTRHTLASILAARGHWEEALEEATRFLAGATTDAITRDVVNLFVGATAAGHGDASLKAIAGSPHALLLEPLSIAVQMFAGGRIEGPLEVLEVARDIAAEIEARRAGV